MFCRGHYIHPYGTATLMTLMRLCARCQRPVPAGQRYCDDCQKTMDQRREESDKIRHQLYNDRRTDQREQKFYKSKDWETLRIYLANKYHGLCLVSYVRDHRIVPFYTMHHIIPVKDDWSKRFKVSNIIPVSESIHQRIEYQYRNGKKTETQRELIEILKTWNQKFASSKI